jgi:hypothetical protein
MLLTTAEVPFVNCSASSVNFRTNSSSVKALIPIAWWTFTYYAPVVGIGMHYLKNAEDILDGVELHAIPWRRVFARNRHPDHGRNIFVVDQTPDLRTKIKLDRLPGR